MVFVNVGVMGWYMVIDSVVVGIFMLGECVFYKFIDKEIYEVCIYLVWVF